MDEKKLFHFETEAIHHGYDSRQHLGSLTPPLYQTSTFSFQSSAQGERRFTGDEAGYIYSRLGNPTVATLEERIAVLEKGEAALAFGSGMAAVSAVLLALTKSYDHILCSQGIYGCTFGLLQMLEKKYLISHSFSPMQTEEQLLEAITPDTTCIFIETPINPTMRLVDLELVHSVATKFNIPVIVDNTFSSPFLQTPLTFGCDVVIHSATKYLGGHGDVIAGLVVGRKEWLDEVANTTQKDIGGVLSPFDAWLILRGIKTLPIRMERHCHNAEKLVNFLKSHPKIESLYYPGDPDHEDYHIMKKQMKAGGGLVSFTVKGSKETAQQFMDRLTLIQIAVSLGDAETLIQHPATMTHAVVPRVRRLEMGISDQMLRLSVGLEAWEDLRDDLKQALDSI